jgi:uncharacterized protein YxeA
MKKIFPLFAFAFILAISSHAQNNENAVNTDNSQLGNNPGTAANAIDLADNNINYSDQLSNNPPVNLSVNNVGNQQQYQQQATVQNNNNRVKQTNVAVFSGSGSRRTNSYTTYGSSAKKHFIKIDIKLGKVHIMRRFFNESAVFKAKTYTKIFKSKKRSIRKCFVF